MKKTKAINFNDGKICVKNEDGSLTYVDSNIYIPQIKENLINYMQTHTHENYTLKELIYGVIKAYFSAEHVFRLPSHVTANINDPLFLELADFCESSPYFNKRVNYKKAVGFMNNSIYIKEYVDTYAKQDEEIYIPIILEKIDEFLDTCVSLKRVSEIIFDATKEAFGIYSIFIPPGETSFVPRNNSNTLYTLFEERIKNNKRYIELLENRMRKSNETVAARREFFEKRKPYDDYVSDRKVRLDKLERSKRPHAIRS